MPLTPIEPFPAKDVRPPVEDAVLEIVISKVDAEELKLFAESVNEPDETVMVAVPPTDCAAVNVAVYDVLLTAEKLLNVPSVALTSTSANVDVASLAVNVTVDAPPELTDDGLALTVIVGAVVS